MWSPLRPSTTPAAEGPIRDLVPGPRYMKRGAYPRASMIFPESRAAEAEASGSEHGWRVPALRVRGFAVEIPTMALTIAVLAVLAYGARVIEGGFSYEGWLFAAYFLHHVHGGAVGVTVAPLAPTRPLQTAIGTMYYTFLGLHSTLYLVVGEVVIGMMALSAYIFLRNVGFGPVDGAAIALLGWLFPFADSVHMITVWSIDSIGVTFYFLGASAALSGLRSKGRRAIALHGLAVLLYISSVLTYEIAAAPILLSAFLYRTAAPWPRALRRGLIDIVAVVPCLVYILVDIKSGGAAAAQGFPIVSLADSLKHAAEIAIQGVALLGVALFPPGGAVVTKTSVLISATLTVVATTALAIACIRLARRDPSARAEVGRWVRVFVAALVGVALGYTFFVPTLAYYHPLGHGDVNRMNILSAFGMAACIYAVAKLAGFAIGGALHRSRLTASVIALSLGTIVGALYIAGDRADASRWNDAIRRQHSILAAIHRALPRLPPRSTVLIEGESKENKIGPGIYAFLDNGQDISGAVEVSYRDLSLQAYSVPNVAAARRYVAESRGPVFLVELHGDTAGGLVRRTATALSPGLHRMHTCPGPPNPRDKHPAVTESGDCKGMAGLRSCTRLISTG